MIVSLIQRWGFLSGYFSLLLKPKGTVNNINHTTSEMSHHGCESKILSPQDFTSMSKTQSLEVPRKVIIWGGMLISTNAHGEMFVLCAQLQFQQPPYF